jgi:hypothetical protein
MAKLGNRLTGKGRMVAVVIATVALVALMVTLVLANSRARQQTTGQQGNDYHPKAEEGTGLTPSKSPAPSGTMPTATPTIPASSGPKTSADNKIVISAPTQGATVRDGSTVSGTATVASGVLYWRLKGGQSGQLGSGQLNVAAGQAANYSFTLGLTNQVSKGGDQGELEVYTLDSKGTATSIASVAVNIGE